MTETAALDLGNQEDLDFATGVLAKLSVLDGDIEKSEARIQKLATALKEEREHREALVLSLRKETRSLREPLPPLFAASLTPAFKEAADIEAGAPVVLLSEVFAGIHKAISACYAAELQTLGQLKAFLDSGKSLADIEGVGGRTAKQMEERLEEYRKRLEAASPVL